MTYAQCKLTRTFPPKISVRCGSVSTVVWIPAEYAVKGKRLRLKEDDGTWTDGWVVEEVWSTTDNPPHPPTAIRLHRERTGDSLPKER